MKNVSKKCLQYNDTMTILATSSLVCRRFREVQQVTFSVPLYIIFKEWDTSLHSILLHERECARTRTCRCWVNRGGFPRFLVKISAIQLCYVTDAVTSLAVIFYHTCIANKVQCTTLDLCWYSSLLHPGQQQPSEDIDDHSDISAWCHH